MKKLCMFIICVFLFTSASAQQFNRERSEQFRGTRGERENSGIPYFSAKGVAISGTSYTHASVNLIKREGEEIIGMLEIGTLKYGLKVENKTDSSLNCAIMKMQRPEKEQKMDNSFFNDGDADSETEPPQKSRGVSFEKIGSFSLNLELKDGEKMGSGNVSVDGATYKLYIMVTTRRGNVRADSNRMNRFTPQGQNEGDFE